MITRNAGNVTRFQLTSWWENCVRWPPVLEGTFSVALLVHVVHSADFLSIRTICVNLLHRNMNPQTTTCLRPCSPAENGDGTCFLDKDLPNDDFVDLLLQHPTLAKHRKFLQSNPKDLLKDLLPEYQYHSVCEINRESLPLRLYVWREGVHCRKCVYLNQS